MSTPRPVRHLLKAREGAAAIEFAIVAPLFFALTLSAFEAGWLMTRTVMQDAAVSRVVRELKITKDMSVTATSVRDMICERSLLFKDCRTKTMVEMIPLRSSADTIPNDRAKCTHRGQAPAFQAGTRAEFVFVRVCTTVKPITPFLGFAVALPDDETGAYGIVSRAAFVNEPE